MKRILFLLMCLCICSCDSFTRHDFEIKNDSSQRVSFQLVKYENKDIYTLESGDSVVLELYDNPEIEFKNHERVYFVSGNSSGHIYDLQKYSYIVFNKSEYNIVLSEEKGLLGDIYGKTEEIHKKESKEIFIYTKYPHWHAYYIADSRQYDGLPFLDFSSSLD